MRNLVEMMLTSAAVEDEPALDAARALFLEFGIRRTTMGDVTRRAGISSATLYRRYPGKDALVGAVIQREARRFILAVDGRVDKSADPEQQLVDGWAALIGELSGNALLRRLLETDAETLLPQIVSAGGPILALGRAYIADNILRLQADGRLADFDADQIAEILARLAATFAVVPVGVIPLDPEGAREFARTHLARLTPG
ncbi:helix-turn-helix transcriptional regulator [Nocardia sp. 2]|uniref:Helix-turn-helix transcriptional regulator n=1 Tax=Nocardia acididurans TaxID=2802282 RepID=A0ABS1M1S8_9NOCA|nr:TetR/AcrR family transcriptional regulator [Nocardia acididurans]MBL1074164.1 helix-turn-helix transcriptional regulator [Nocardia acididurans]